MKSFSKNLRTFKNDGKSVEAFFGAQIGGMANIVWQKVPTQVQA